MLLFFPLPSLINISCPNLSCLLATTFSSLRYPNSLSSTRFNLLRVSRISFSWFSVFLYSHLILCLYFLCSSVTEALFALSFSFLCERFVFIHAKSALAYIRNEKHGCHGSVFNRPKITLSMRVLGPRTSAYEFRVTPDLHLYLYIITSPLINLIGHEVWV